MKRTQRFMCSAASPSSFSSAASRIPKGSKTSSARGDGLSGVAEHKVFRSPSSRRSKTVSDIRPQSGGSTNSRKTAEPTRAPRPNFGSLQNAVVLAPFHALKSRFQDKLMDLYSREKIKKVGRRSKLAKQQNASFQYDVIELKPQGSTLKKETISSKKGKKKPRSPSYCQCKSLVAKDGERSSLKNAKRRKKMSDEDLPVEAPRFSGGPEVGRRQASPERGAAQTSRSDIIPLLDFYLADEPFAYSDAGPRSSAVSSPETGSDSSSSSRDGLVEGSFTISSTSFASCLKHFVRNRDRPEGKRSGREKNRKSTKRTKEKFLPKPKADSSRHLIVRLEKKNTDEHIVHFLDREPRARAIPFAESSRHLQPLRRQGRGKEKKMEDERASTYYLRSLSSGKRIPSEPNPGEREKRCPRRGNDSGGNKISQMEVATQVGRSVSERGASAGRVDPRSRQGGVTAEACPEDVPGERDGGEPLPEANFSSSPREPAGDSELPDEVLLPQRIGTLESRAEESNLAFPGERSDSDSTEMADCPGDRFQEFAGPQEPQDKESDFIFGPRNAASRLGGSCEFSFGLNSVFPEDED